MRVLLLLIVVLPLCAVFAAEIEGSAAASGGYDTNVGYLTLVDRLSGGGAEQVADYFVKSTFDLSATPKKESPWTFTGTVRVLHFLRNPLHSRIDSYGDIGCKHIFSDKLTGYSMLQLHHAAKDLHRVTQFYADTHYLLDLFYDVSDALALHSEFKAGYYGFPAGDIRFLTGPAAGIDGAVFYYTSAGRDYIKPGAGIAFYGFRNEVYQFEDAAHAIAAIVGRSNKYIDLHLFVEGRYNAGDAAFLLAADYSFLAALKKDSITESSDGSGFSDQWLKARQEHLFSIRGSLHYSWNRHCAAAFNYQMQKSFSNINSRERFNLDYSFLRHVAALELILDF